MLLVVLLTLQSASAPVPPQPYRSAPITVMAEPVALLLSGFDRDGDAQVTRTELSAGIDALRGTDAAWDKGKGYLAFTDWAQRWLGDRNAAPTPFETDRDGDNRISFDELANRIGAIFDRYDVNRDGTLARSELLTVRATPFGSDRPGERRSLRPRD